MNIRSMLKGSYVALVTPFKNGKVDEAKLKELVEWHIENGTDGLVPCGSTGESAALSYAEHKRVTEIVIQTSKGSIPVIAGAGSNSTEETLDLVKHAHRAGADGVLLVAPYYNKPTPEGMYRHFKTVAKATPLPIILYNIPGRSAVSITPETTIRLAKDCPTIVGIKEASGTMDYTSQLFASLDPEQFVVFSGDDSLTVPLMALGAKGVISVMANILPKAISELCHFCETFRYEGAQDLQRVLFPLMRALFIETNPIPIKAAMAKLGMCRDELRLPLVSMSPGARKALYAAMDACPPLKRRRRND